MFGRIKKLLMGAQAQQVEQVAPEPVVEEPVEPPKPDLIRVVQVPEAVNVQDQIISCYSDMTGTFESFRLLVDALAVRDHLNVKPLCQFKSGHADDKVNVGIRVDVDADALTACRMARYGARVGVASSYYLLPTALYYGAYQSDLLVRSPDLPQLIQDLIVTGCEIGLHNDVMHIAATTDIDPVAALWTELFWLRSHGANVQGTVGHNSIVVYGVENSEVFKNRVLWDREVKDQKGRPFPLGLVDETSFGLLYEGTFAKVSEATDIHQAEAFSKDAENASIRQKSWMKTYLTENPCHDWDIDLQVWAIGQDRWVVGGGDTFIWDVPLAQVLEVVTESEVGSEILIVLHPEYFRG